MTRKFRNLFSLKGRSFFRDSKCTDALTYHQSVKDQQHIFLYCVLGRSSSTALQRILNSSNEICIWGEHHLTIDKLVDTIQAAEALRDMPHVAECTRLLNQCFKKNKHDLFYPNAIGNISGAIDMLKSSISLLLKPTVAGLSRFGIKEINASSLTTLNYLRSEYTKSQFAFCFRDPLVQWPSVHHVEHWGWEYSKTLDIFLQEYDRVSTIHLDFASEHKLNSFIENTDLNNEANVLQIISHFHISSVDTALIGLTVFSVGPQRLTESDRLTIVQSKAYRNYKAMKLLSQEFYKAKLSNSNT